MIALGLLVVVVVLLVLVATSRHGTGTVEHRVASAGPPAVAVAPQLRRWVGAGLLTDAQAEAIRAYEERSAPARAPARPRASSALEALAYVGGVLVAVGAGLLVARFWDDLGVVGRLGVLSVAAAATGIVGAVVGEADPVAWRLRGFLWALSAVGVAAVAGLFAFEVADATGEPVALAAAGTGAAASAAYWWRQERPLQHLLAFGGLAVAVGVAVEWVAGPGSGAVIGGALWAVGLAWALLAWRHLLPPIPEGIALGAALTLVASGILASQIEWLAPLVGLATATAWVGLGAWRIGPAALAPGVTGIFAFLPWALGYFFGEALGAPAIAMVSGALLLGVVVYLVWRGGGLGGSTKGGAAAPVPPGVGGPVSSGS